jgi:hypothetical protein
MSPTFNSMVGSFLFQFHLHQFHRLSQDFTAVSYSITLSCSPAHQESCDMVVVVSVIFQELPSDVSAVASNINHSL